MSLFDLLFLALMAASVVTLVVAAGLALRGNRLQAGAILKKWAFGFLAYMGVVVAVSIFLPRRVARVGEALCSDDWCLTVDGAAAEPGAYRVGFRIESRALRVTQREYGVTVYLTDAAGRRYDARQSPSDVPFDTPIGPGQAFATTRVFDVPDGARPIGLVIRQSSGFPIGWFIVGYETWFRKPTMVRLGGI